jgi:hypothetical protein
MHLFHIIALVLSIVVIYWPVYRFEFLYGWDDQWFVTNPYTENGFNWDNLYGIITEYYYGQYAPLNQIYYTSLYSLVGYNQAIYHIVSVLLHLANVILVYFLLNTITAKLTNHTSLLTRQASFLAALLFAILPINIEPVAWIAASKVTLYTLFYLMALFSYCKYITTFRPSYFYLTLIFFIFSIGAKEQAVLLPICLILIDYVYDRNLKNKIVWFEKLPFFILALLFGIITVHSQELEYQERPFYPIYQRIPLAFYSLSEYFTKCLIPINISYLYPFPFQVGEQVPWWLWIYVFAMPLTIYGFFYQIKTNYVFFGLIFFFTHVVLVINILPLARFSVVADRYAYLSSIGLSYIASCLFVFKRSDKKRSNHLLIAGTIYFGMLAIYSRIHITTWSDAYTLKSRLKNAIEQRDDFRELKKSL